MSSLGDWIPTVHFEELNLLPRVLFRMGAVIFVAAVIARDRQFAPQLISSIDLRPRNSFVISDRG